MRIQIITDAWHPQMNGVVRTIEETQRELERRGHIVSIIGPDQFYNVALPIYPDIRLSIAIKKRLERLITDFKADDIHIATEGPLGWATRRWCLKNHVSFTTAYHTRFPEYVAARAPVPSALTYAFLKRFHGPASAVMVTTQSIANDLSKRGFKNIAYWTKGVDCDVFRPIPGGLENLSKPILLYAGRISVEKNLEAFLKLPIKGSKVIVGDGPYLNKLKKDFPDAVFTGRLSGDDLSRAYSAADVFVFPSLTDTFGLVLAEALACGTPISAFDVAGPRDILSIQDKKLPVGVLDDDLQKAIEKCLSLSIPADRCRKFVLDNYTWKIATDQFLARPGIAVSYSGPK